MATKETKRPFSSDALEIAWAAGFFDGEGSIFVNHLKRVPHRDRVNPAVYDVTSVTLSISQVEKGPLEKFTKIIGGRTPTGPYKPRQKKACPYYRWDSMGRPSVHRVLTLLWPFLSGPKRAQSRAAWAELEACKGKKSPNLPPLPEITKDEDVWICPCCLGDSLIMTCCFCPKWCRTTCRYPNKERGVSLDGK